VNCWREREQSPSAAALVPRSTRKRRPGAHGVPERLHEERDKTETCIAVTRIGCPLNGVAVRVSSLENVSMHSKRGELFSAAACCCGLCFIDLKRRHLSLIRIETSQPGSLRKNALVCEKCKMCKLLPTPFTGWREVSHLFTAVQSFSWKTIRLDQTNWLPNCNNALG
jgi:hypothetical protein